MNEQWKPIDGYHGSYEVSDRGRVRSLDRVVPHGSESHLTLKGRIMKPGAGATGHLYVVLTKGPGTKKHHKVHRLVLSAFIGPCPEGMEACHNDGNPANNRLDNLRWDTRSANRWDSVRHGTHNQVAKTHCKNGHPYFSELNLPSLKKKGHRYCTICTRADGFIRYHGTPEKDHWAVIDMKTEEWLLEMEGEKTRRNMVKRK